jgi:hypothetical protein
MINEPKPFASLSSGLLARKGAARPAMRPQGFGQAGAALEDLGWNDMGFEPPKPASAPRDATHDAFGDEVVEHPHVHPTGLTPVQSPVHSQQAEIVDRLAGEDREEPEPAETAELYEPEAEAEPELDETAERYETETETEAEVEPELDQIAERYEPEPESEAEPELDEIAERYEPEPEAESELDELAERYEPKPEAEADPEPEPAPVPFVAAVPATKARRLAPPRAATGSKGKAAFTLRLDPSRHLKLRLACAVNGRSAQQLVTDALDQLLVHMPELDTMAETAKRKG